MKRKVLAMIMSVMMIASLTACGGSSGGDSAAGGDDAAASEDSGDGYKVSIILKTQASEHWKLVQAGCEAYANEHDNVTVDVKGPSSETSFDEQQNMIETDLNSGAYDAFIISPLQADLVSTLVAGQEKPIIAMDTDVDAPEILSFVGTGNQKAAAMGGEAAVEAAKEAGWKDIKCIEIAGVQGETTNEARMNGYIEGVEGAGGDFLEDEMQYADAVADKAVTCMEAIMQNHPEGIAIVCANNDDMAVAAARAAAENEAYKDTIFCGFDGQISACESILNDELNMTVAQEAYNMGYMAVDTIVKALEGEELEEFVDSGCEIITKDNAQEHIDTLKGYLGE